MQLRETMSRRVDDTAWSTAAVLVDHEIMRDYGSVLRLSSREARQLGLRDRLEIQVRMTMPFRQCEHSNCLW